MTKLPPLARDAACELTFTSQCDMLRSRTVQDRTHPIPAAIQRSFRVRSHSTIPATILHYSDITFDPLAAFRKRTTTAQAPAIAAKRPGPPACPAHVASADAPRPLNTSRNILDVD